MVHVTNRCQILLIYEFKYFFFQYLVELYTEDVEKGKKI